MKKLIFNITILMCIIFASCSDDDSVNIVSLNTFGTKFCRNDVVKVFVSPNSAMTPMSAMNGDVMEEV